ncbi:alpha-amylase family glycosyl hydrolase [Arthrobacter sp. N1]|uniref:alpha-amylase family glycosyl hydrolase n=1 Tax=Arthrobacter sp. N1 TaxID=619291 RepID=UPI003BB1A204
MTGTDPQAEWWRDAVVYQVYPRSFADHDGDGVGDLPGLTARLPYIADLGVDGLWITPFQPSPHVDQGYDVSDYCGVDPLFGTLADFDDVLDAAHGLGLRVLMDIAPNHCSSEHPLFQAALAAGPGSPERDLFHFADGPDGDTPPNNWISSFGDRSWTRAHPGSDTDQQWYLHIFSSAQPDWNWRNPAVGDFFEDVIRFWFDRGVDGLRVDVAHGLFKSEGLPHAEDPAAVARGLRFNPHLTDQEELHGVYRRWRVIADGYSPARVLVGEVNLDADRAARLVRPDEMHQAFAYPFVKVPWDAATWASAAGALTAAHAAHGAAPAWSVENHDVVRAVTRYGGGARGQARARAALLTVLALPGGAYLYQGQELGLPEVDVPVGDRVDPMWLRGGISRDGARIPLPWTTAEEGSFGFSPAGTDAPWLPTPSFWGRYSIEDQWKDRDSMLTFVTTALALRTSLVADGTLVPAREAGFRVEDGGLLVCARGGRFLAVMAMGDQPARLPAGDLLLATAPLTGDGLLPPDAGAWLVRAP